MSDNDQMKLFVDNLWRYFEPKIEEKMRSSIRYYRAEVTANPGGNRLTVQRPFDTAVTIPCVDCMSDAKAGDQVLVMVFGGGVNGRNSVVVGDGALHALGGGKSPLPITNGGTGAETESEFRQTLIDMGFVNGLYIKAGTKVITTTASPSAVVFTMDQLTTLFGPRSPGWGIGNTVCLFCNGDYVAQAKTVVSICNSDGWCIRTTDGANFAAGSFRVNYLAIGIMP